MRRLFFIALSGLLIAGCATETEPPEVVPPDPQPTVCDISSDSEKTPAYPFDFARFEAEVWPALTANCGASGCHLSPGAGGYDVWPASETECPDIKSFNAFFALSDTQIEPRTSAIITAIDKTDVDHPLQYEADDETLVLLLDYIAAAKATRDATAPPASNAGYFDREVYETEIDPLIHLANCTTSNCHNGSDGSSLGGDFGLIPNPQPGSDEMKANLEAVTNLIQVGKAATADETKFYIYALNGHRNVTFGFEEQGALRDWIEDALDANPPTNRPLGCVDTDAFNLDVFEEEIMPMFRGDVDYNDRDNGSNATGCARSECHGKDRGPGIFYLDDDATPEERVSSFSCYVDLENPSNSQVLLCPLNLPGCSKSSDHPGEDVFAGVDDRNYQRLLSYIYATRNGASPLDFAFFVRKINVLFNDEDAVEDGARNQTCATFGCHGIAAPGEKPSSGSNFGIIPEARTEADLVENFIQASNFVFFPDASQSSLFLYPTNEIANADNDLATGVPHTGGKDFDVADQEALDILKWSGGLFPNQDGFLQDVLIAGIFNTDSIDDDPINNPEDELPRIFKRSGQPSQFRDGEWDGFFSDQAFIDFNQAFNNGVNGAGGSTAYAAMYLTNADSRDLEVSIVVESPNDVELFIGQGNPGDVGVDGTVARTVLLPAYSDAKQPVRVLVKVFQEVGAPEFGFTINFTDGDDKPLNNKDRRLVFTLSNINAGI